MENAIENAMENAMENNTFECQNKNYGDRIQTPIKQVLTKIERRDFHQRLVEKPPTVDIEVIYDIDMLKAEFRDLFVTDNSC